ncbi:MAG: hydroxysqualene dehydroxylase HpnE [Sulfuriflexus sp.]|nr:hydroxysqualene dehydroxylase HpnE [Sulfuriflexus sp.]
MSNSSRKIAIIGGGWAGLSAAVKLTNHGHHVTLFESAKQLGGRARCVAFGEQRVDNGQHLLLGAYTETLNMLQLCGVKIDNALLRSPLNIKVIERQGAEFNLSPSRLPAPLNILTALLTLPSLSIRERLKTIWFLLKLRLSGFKIRRDITVRKLLRHQPEIMVKMFWEPLCIAALNTAINDASAKIFLNVLKDSFTQKPEASDLLIPKVDLANLFVHPAMQYIEEHGGTLLLGKKINSIQKINSKYTVIDADDHQYDADDIILAGSPKSTLALLEKSALLETTQEQLRQLIYEPICTIYLQYANDIRLPLPMIGLTNCTGQWIFDRHFCGQAGLMAVVISASGPHMQLDKMTLAQLVSDELTELFDWPDANSSLVIREKRATFKAHVDIDKLRPNVTTSEKNLWLCGDYTASPYPATLEAAVQSGLQCSHEIIHYMK